MKPTSKHIILLGTLLCLFIYSPRAGAQTVTGIASVYFTGWEDDITGPPLQQQVAWKFAVDFETDLPYGSNPSGHVACQLEWQTLDSSGHVTNTGNGPFDMPPSYSLPVHGYYIGYSPNWPSNNDYGWVGVLHYDLEGLSFATVQYWMQINSWIESNQGIFPRSGPLQYNTQVQSMTYAQAMSPPYPSFPSWSIGQLP